MPTEGFVAEVFGLPLAEGPLAAEVCHVLQTRAEQRACPYLGGRCTQAFPVCAVWTEQGALPLCPHRLQEGGRTFRALAPLLPGPRPVLLRHFHTPSHPVALGWVLFDANHHDQWLGLSVATPLPTDHRGLRDLLHHALRHDTLAGGYPLHFSWSRSAYQAAQWLRPVGDLARSRRRPVFVFLPQELYGPTEGYLKGLAVDRSYLSLVPVEFVFEAGRFRVGVPEVTTQGDWKPDPVSLPRILERRAEWILLDILEQTRVEM